jgi:histone deacetylase complex regulatory component SIN3
MKQPRTIILVLLILATGLLPVTISLRRLAAARESLASAQALLLQTAREAQEIVDLRSQTQTFESRQRPAQDVIAQVNLVLAEAGIPSQHFESLTPEAEAATSATSASAGARLFRQSVRLVLEDLTPEQIGLFLLQWRTSQPIWPVSRIELVHNRSRGTKDDRAANQYDATVLLTALYVGDAPQAPSASTSSSLLSLAMEGP